MPPYYDFGESLGVRGDPRTCQDQPEGVTVNLIVSLREVDKRTEGLQPLLRGRVRHMSSQPLRIRRADTRQEPKLASGHQTLPQREGQEPVLKHPFQKLARMVDEKKAPVIVTYRRATTHTHTSTCFVTVTPSPSIAIAIAS